MDKERSGKFMQKVVGDVATALASALVLTGDKAGLFRAMAGAGAIQATELASRAGIHPRYAEEWLAAMACAGYVEYDGSTDCFTLPEEHAVFFANPASEYYLGGLFTGLPGLIGVAAQLGRAFASGGGISFAEFGEQLPLALESMNRSVYENRLVQSWLPTMPAVVQKLEQGGRAIDIGCGTGIVPLTLARAFPQATIEGLDLDPRSIEIARGYAHAAGLSDRLRFTEGAASTLGQAGTYDFISTFDVIHDLPDPAATLRDIRCALADGGTYLMVEPRVDDKLENNQGNPFGRMLFAISCLHCVPQSLAQGGPGLGACWGPAKARAMVLAAGFGIECVEVDRRRVRLGGLLGHLGLAMTEQFFARFLYKTEESHLMPLVFVVCVVRGFRPAWLVCCSITVAHSRIAKPLEGRIAPTCRSATRGRPHTGWGPGYRTVNARTSAACRDSMLAAIRYRRRQGNRATRQSSHPGPDARGSPYCFRRCDRPRERLGLPDRRSPRATGAASDRANGWCSW